MALTNAEKQRRFRDRNVIVLTDRAEEIAEKLIDMEDQAKRARSPGWSAIISRIPIEASTKGTSTWVEYRSRGRTAGR